MASDFMGKSYHNLDQKNRLAVPIRFRSELGEEFVVCKPLTDDKCLYLYTLDGWNAVVESVRAKVSGRERTNTERIMFMNIEKVTADAQGRFTIKPEFCEAVDLGKNVAILGVGHRVEIWNADELDALEADQKSVITFDVDSIDY